LLIPEAIGDSLKELSNFETEIGGGIVLDKKKNKIVKIVIFPSNDRYRITFDSTKYDIEFHTHPVVSKKPDDIRLARIPSPADISSTFTTGKEEIAFAGGYVFSISIYDKNLFEKTKKDIRETYKDKKFDSSYDRYRAYFDDVFDGIRKESKKLPGSNRVRFITKKWKHKVRKFGVITKRVNLKNEKFNIY